jgi:hypothetical protein
MEFEPDDAEEAARKSVGVSTESIVDACYRRTTWE